MSELALDFGRNICNNLSTAGTREWLVTNGIGGFAAGTVAGLLTRRYHGLLIAALNPPLGRTLLVAKGDDTITYQGHAYPLFSNRWRADLVDPAGYIHLDRFYLDDGLPVWEYSCGDAIVQRRLWMEQGANITYLTYRILRAAGPLQLHIKWLVNYRDYHSQTAGGWAMRIEPVPAGLCVHAHDGATPFYVLSDAAQTAPRHAWHNNFYLSLEAYRGLPASEDHLHAGESTATLSVGENLTFALSLDAAPDLDGAAALARRRAHQSTLYRRVTWLADEPDGRLAQLVLAADQFIVERATPSDPHGHTVIAGYPWFSDWGRDTMIALPGLTLTTGRPEIAASLLRTFAHFVDRGMLPNRFPDVGETPEYNTADATLWYFEAIRAYSQATNDMALVRALWPVLQDIVDWHQRGTRYQMHVDPADGLLFAGEAGVQLTWMDAKVGDWVVTPRIGKAVELNALWYNALSCMAQWAGQLGEAGAGAYADAAAQAARGFGRFWQPDAGYCFDVLDGPFGHDAQLRPNQLFAVALPHSPLTAAHQKSIVDRCARDLWTPHGLRSLGPAEPAYTPQYGGDQRQRDAAYHQGVVWAWLIGPFVQAHLRVYDDPALARSYLEPLLRHLPDHGVGSVSEIFDGDAPFTPRGCFAQAWSVAELLRAWVSTRPTA